MEVLDAAVLVGRGPQCGLVIDDPSVSSTHAELLRRDGQIVVRDLNSTNGTMVDGQRISSETVLRPGGSVTFGAVTFVLRGSELVQSQTTDRTQVIGAGAAASSGPGAMPPSSPAPPVGSPAAKTEGISSGLTRWLKGLLEGYVGLLALVMLSTILMFVYFEQAMSGNGGAYDSWDTWDTIYVVLFLLSVLLSVPIFVLLIVWSRQAHIASDSLQPGDRRWGRGWTIGAWFIPIANYILLPLVLGEIRKIATAPRNAGKVDSNWPRESVSAPLILWFVFYAIGGVLFYVGDTALGNAFDENEYRGGLVLVLIGLAFTGAGALLGASFVKDVAAKLSRDD